MSTDWKPGDVALTVDGKRIFRHGERWITANPGFNRSKIALYVDTIDARPLVVIDPESAEDVKRLADLYWEAFYAAGHHGGREARHITGLAAALREFAAPTLPEPAGLGAVVEDARGIRWVRTYSVEHDTAWVTGNHRRPWSEVGAVRVLSEGVPQ